MSVRDRLTIAEARSLAFQTKMCSGRRHRPADRQRDRPPTPRPATSIPEDRKEIGDGRVEWQGPAPVKKALAIATLAIAQRPGPLQSKSDQADMKDLLGRMIESDVEFEHYARAARIAVTGEPD